MRAQDIEKLVSVGRPEIAPDGSFAVFATSRPDLAANRAVGQLWRVDLPGRHAAPPHPRHRRRLSAAVARRLPHRVPARRREGQAAAASSSTPAGGEPVQATDASLGVEEFAWSPDGATIAFTARVPEKGRYGTVEGLDAAAEAPAAHHRHPLARQRARLPRPTGPRTCSSSTRPQPDAEPFYEPAAAVRPDDETPPKKTARRRRGARS